MLSVAAASPDPPDQPPRESAAPTAFIPAAGDVRLYQPDGDEWQAHIMRGSQQQYCYAKEPDKDYFHLIVAGEIYVQRGDEKFCLMCALREGILTANRLYWQFPWRKQPPAGKLV